MIFGGDVELVEEGLRLALRLPAAELGKLALELRRPHAVLFGELGVCVERVLFIHHFDEALMAQHDRAQHRLEVVFVLILREYGHTLVLAERHFALVGLDLTREDL